MTKGMEVDQFAEFVSAVTRCLPRRLSLELGQHWIDNQRALTDTLSLALGAHPVEEAPAVTSGEPRQEPAVSLFNRLLAACHQSWVHSNVTEAHFPLEDDGTNGPIEEFCFNREIAGMAIEYELNKLGFRPIGMKRGMEYIADHLGNQLKYPVVVFVQWKDSNEDIFVPYFFAHGDRDRRGLDLRWLKRLFRPDCHFLVSREPAAQ